MALDQGIRRAERRVDVDAEILAKPANERNSEAALGALEDLGRQQVGNRAAQHALERHTANLGRGRDSKRKIHELGLSTAIGFSPVAAIGSPRARG
jgi:hypothetical protein